MRIHRAISFLFITLTLGGCATQTASTYNYHGKAGAKVENEIVVNESFETVWSNLVKQLAKSFFIVNNIAKESRLINVSFFTDSPEKYIDCGTSVRTYTKGEERTEYNYKVAGDSSYKMSGGKSPNGMFSLVAYVDRKTGLEGRINVYVSPKEKNTEVTVNTRYIFTMGTSGQNTAENLHGQVVQRQAFTPGSSTISFNTNQPNKSKDGIECFSKGVLESDILDMVNRS